jgi:XTP/dITP diphosphohydrolase
MKLLIATANAHKLEEMSGLLRAVPLELVSLRDVDGIEMPEETGTTMLQNARLKALACARQSGLPSLADDSGIETDWLRGAPGVHSARWRAGSDADRTNSLLEELQNAPEDERGARYRCALCLAWAPRTGLSYDGELMREETEATCEGRIAREWRGENGFGYDPIFELTPQSGAPAEWIGKSMAQAPPEIKALISHRARAVAAIVPVLQMLAK